MKFYPKHRLSVRLGLSVFPVLPVFILMSCLCMLLFSGCNSGNHNASSDAELAKAKKLIAEGNFNAAFVQLNRALAEAPRDPQVHLNLGWLYLYTDDPANAERELTIAASLAPDLADTYKLRGDVFSYKGQHAGDEASAKRDQEDAVANYEKALQRDAKNYQTYFDMANSLVAMGRYEEALDKLDKGFDYIPKKDLETQVNFQVATCSAETKLKRYDDAIADCQQAYEFTNNPASKERIETMIENMKLLNPGGIPSKETQGEAPSSQNLKNAEDNAVVNEAASD